MVEGRDHALLTQLRPLVQAGLGFAPVGGQRLSIHNWYAGEHAERPLTGETLTEVDLVAITESGVGKGADGTVGAPAEETIADGDSAFEIIRIRAAEEGRDILHECPACTM